MDLALSVNMRRVKSVYVVVCPTHRSDRSVFLELLKIGGTTPYKDKRIKPNKLYSIIIL